MFDLNARNVPYILRSDDNDLSNLRLVFTGDELWKNLPDLAYECVKFWVKWHPIITKEESLCREPFFSNIQYNPYGPFLGQMATVSDDPYAKRDDEEVFKMPTVYESEARVINDLLNEWLL